MASGYALSFFRINPTVSHHDVYIWGESELDYFLQECINSASQDLSRSRYVAISKPQPDVEPLKKHQSANILLEHLNKYYNIDEFFALSRYVLPMIPLHLVIQSVNAPHIMGSRTELRNVSQGCLGKEMFLMLRTSPITAPTHTLPPIAQHAAILGGGTTTRVRLLVGEVDFVSSDPTKLPLKDDYKTMLLMVTIELNFRRNNEILPSGSNYQNRLVYFNSPNEAIVDQISIKNNLNSSADFSISKAANVLMSSYINDDGHRDEYKRFFQGSSISETVEYELENEGVPDLSMASQFRFNKHDAKYNQNVLHEIDMSMDTSFASYNYDTKATEPRSILKRTLHETGATAPKTSHPGYTFGLPVNIRSTFVENATLARYSYSLEHQFVEVNLAQTIDVLAYVPSDVVFSVHTSMFLIDGKGEHCLPVSHIIADFPFLKLEPLPQLSVESLDLISVRLCLTENVTDAISSRLLHEDTIIFKEEIKTDSPKLSSRQSSIDLTRLPSSVCQATIVIPKIESPRHVRYLTWNYAGYVSVVPKYKSNTRFNLIGGTTLPFDPTELIKYLKDDASYTVFPELSLSSANWIADRTNWEFLVNALRRKVLERHYTMTGYTLTTHPVAYCEGMTLQHLVHYKHPMPRELNKMLRHFNKSCPRGLNVDNIWIIEYAHHGSDIINQSPRGLNLSKINQARIDLAYDSNLELLVPGHVDVKFIILHYMMNIQQSTNNISYATFVH